MSNQPTIHVTKHETFEVRFGGFEGLPARKGIDFVCSPTFTCFGHTWCLRLCPGGTTSSDDGKVSISLHHMSSIEKMKVQASFFVKKSAWTIAAYTGLKECETTSWGIPNFAKRSTIIDALQDGSLVIEVKMRHADQANPTSIPFIPQNPLSKSILKKFMDEKSADVVFEVGSKQVKTARKKKAKTSLATFHTHRFILQECAPLLGELCKAEGVSTVPISDVKPDTFRHLLYYVYGGHVPEEELKANAKEIIDAADKYGISSLKLEAEACYVKSTPITIDNMMDNLLYADAKNCALLKEAVMDFIVENGIEVAEKVSLKDVPGGLFAELLTAMNRGKTKVAGGESLGTMRINELRRKLDEKGLDVDGSREAMIASLKENS